VSRYLDLILYWALAFRLATLEAFGCRLHHGERR
jgi:hypothetical protein